MAVLRRIDRQKEWWVDFRYRRKRIRRRSPVQSKHGAEQFERQLRQEFSDDIAHGKNPFEKSPVFAEYAERWMRDYVEPNNRPSVRRDKRIALRLHLIPEFGRLRIDEIDAAAIDRLAATKVAAGFKPKSVNNILSILHTSLVTAADWNLLRVVPRVHWRRVPEQRYRVLSELEERALLSVIPDGCWRTLVIFLLHTGTRFSEAAAAKWEDIELHGESPVLRVCRGGARGIPGDTKTGSHRELPLTPEVFAALGRMPHVEEKLFPNRNGTMMDPGSKAKYLYRFCDLAGVKRFGWHTFRHTFATRMAAAGIPVHVLQRLLGHTTIKMTTRYVHVDPATLLSTMDTIRRALPIETHYGTPAATILEPPSVIDSLPC